MSAKKKTNDEYIKAAKLKHGDKYSYLKTKYTGAMNKIIITCNSCNQDIEITANNHLHLGQGCSSCYNPSHILSNKEFVEKAKKARGESKFDYSKSIYLGMGEKVLIVCNVCKHEFKQLAGNHLRGYGCPNCTRISRCHSKEQYTAKAKSIHGNKYDYSSSIYIGSKNPISIKCNQCSGNFEVDACDHLNGAGCKVCEPKYYENLENKNLRMSEKTFLESALIKYGDKYDYSNCVYTKARFKVKISCNNCKNEFEVLPKKHLEGRGCPHCYN